MLVVSGKYLQSIAKPLPEDPRESALSMIAAIYDLYDKYLPEIIVVAGDTRGSKAMSIVYKWSEHTCKVIRGKVLDVANTAIQVAPLQKKRHGQPNINTEQFKKPSFPYSKGDKHSTNTQVHVCGSDIELLWLLAYGATIVTINKDKTATEVTINSFQMDYPDIHPVQWLEMQAIDNVKKEFGSANGVPNYSAKEMIQNIGSLYSLYNTLGLDAASFLITGISSSCSNSTIEKWLKHNYDKIKEAYLGIKPRPIKLLSIPQCNFHRGVDLLKSLHGIKLITRTSNYPGSPNMSNHSLY